MATPRILTDEALGELKRVATAATPGPWDYVVHGPQPTVFAPDRHVICDLYRGIDLRVEQPPKNAAHIAAFNPETALTLLAMLEQARARLAEVERRLPHCDACGASWYDDGANQPACPYCRIAEVERERDAAHRMLAGVHQAITGAKITHHSQASMEALELNERCAVAESALAQMREGRNDIVCRLIRELELDPDDIVEPSGDDVGDLIRLLRSHLRTFGEQATKLEQAEARARELESVAASTYYDNGMPKLIGENAMLRTRLAQVREALDRTLAVLQSSSITTSAVYEAKRILSAALASEAPTPTGGQ